MASLVAHALLALPLASAAQWDTAVDFGPLTYVRRAQTARAEALAPRIGAQLPPALPNGRAAVPALPVKRWTSASLVELPRDALPGRYARPRYALGFRADALRDRLKQAGVDAQSCLAPVLRVHAKLSGDRVPSGTLWLYARCWIN